MYFSFTLKTFKNFLDCNCIYFYHRRPKIAPLKLVFFRVIQRLRRESGQIGYNLEISKWATFGYQQTQLTMGQSRTFLFEIFSDSTVRCILYKVELMANDDNGLVSMKIYDTFHH